LFGNPAAKNLNERFLFIDGQFIRSVNNIGECGHRVLQQLSSPEGAL